MAVANTIAAIRAGVGSVDVTVNGLGERAGNAALEEVVMACRVALQIDCGIDTHSLTDLSHWIGQLAARPVPVQKPITGKGVFLHESESTSMPCCTTAAATRHLCPNPLDGPVKTLSSANIPEEQPCG
jgi:isopropylmalate/homocitrate/citramalate synthase